MKRKGESETKPPQVTQVTEAPITESNTTQVLPTPTENVQTVTEPPISENTPTITTKPAEPTNQVTETTAPPLSELETVATTEPQPVTAAPPTGNTMPPPGRGSRTFEDYLRLDWTRSNSDLAAECGVSRQAIAQMRRKVEQHKANGGAIPTFDDVTKKEETITQKVVDYSAMAGMVFDMSTGILTMTFGQEWQPKPAEPGKPGERDVVVGALANYFQSKQVTDIPPGLMLTVVCVAYAGPRLREPNTSSKIKMGWTWLKLKINNLRKKRL